MSESDDVTAAMLSPAEQAAWEVAVKKRLNITAADVREICEAFHIAAACWAPGMTRPQMEEALERYTKTHPHLCETRLADG